MMYSINIFPLYLIFLLPFCESRFVSLEKEENREFSTTEDSEIAFTSDRSEEFNSYDVAKTATPGSEEKMLITERDETTSLMATRSSLMDVENTTEMADNSTITEMELSDFIPESDTENVTDSSNVTDEMESVTLTVSDSLLQTETNQFVDVSTDLDSYSLSGIQFPHDPNASVDYEDSFDLNTDVTTTDGINDTILHEESSGNISMDYYLGIADTGEVITRLLNQSHDLVPVSAWSDTVGREHEKKEEEKKGEEVEEEQEEQEEEEEEEEEEERKDKKSISDTLDNGIEETDRECGIPSSGHRSRKKRVVGGTRIVYGQVPWIVSMRFRGDHPFINETGFTHLCGATLIHPYWLLSAAHCFSATNTHEHTSNASFWYAILGENSLGTQEETEKMVEIEKIIVHENYTYLDSFNNDVALLKLSEPIKETQYIKFICLDQEGIVTPGEMCTVAGWGLHSYGGNGSAYPFQATLNVLSPSDCNEKVEHIHEKFRDWYSNAETTFCADSDKGKDTCQGDSGGPFQCYRNGRWYLTGLTSSGYRCGVVPGVYTRVGYFIDWINEKMKEN